MFTKCFDVLFVSVLAHEWRNSLKIFAFIRANWLYLYICIVRDLEVIELKSIGSLDVSIELKAMAAANNFVFINDLLQVPLHKFHELRGSGYRLLREWVIFLEVNGLMAVVKR